MIMVQDELNPITLHQTFSKVTNTACDTRRAYDADALSRLKPIDTTCVVTTKPPDSVSHTSAGRPLLIACTIPSIQHWRDTHANGGQSQSGTTKTLRIVEEAR
jgi:hypothetical protein